MLAAHQLDIDGLYGDGEDVALMVESAPGSALLCVFLDNGNW